MTSYLGSVEDMMRVSKLAFHRVTNYRVYQSSNQNQSDLIWALSCRTGFNTENAGYGSTSRSAVPTLFSVVCQKQILRSFLHSLRANLTHLEKKAFHLIPSFFSKEKLAMLSVTRTRTLAPMGKALRAVSTWSNVPAGPPDPILGTFLLFAPVPNLLGLYIVLAG